MCRWENELFRCAGETCVIPQGYQAHLLIILSLASISDDGSLLHFLLCYQNQISSLAVKFT